MIRWGRLTAGAAAGIATLGMLIVWAAPASAHSVLLATSPARSATVASAPSSVVLTFNEMPQGEYSDIHIVGPDGQRRDSGHVRVLNDTVAEALGGTRPAGTYVVDWRVISADGHPVSGQFSFTATSAASALAARQADTISSSHAKGTATAVVIIVVVAVLVLAAIAALLTLRRRRPATASSSSRPDEDD